VTIHLWHRQTDIRIYAVSEPYIADQVICHRQLSLAVVIRKLGRLIRKLLPLLTWVKEPLEELVHHGIQMQIIERIAHMENHMEKGIKELIDQNPVIADILNEYEIGCGPCNVGTCLLKDIVEIHRLGEADEKELYDRIGSALSGNEA
jgi:hypothetical protein